MGSQVVGWSGGQGKEKLPKVTNFKDLLVWQQAMELSRLVYILTRRFPADEKYGLTSQLKRASVSVPSNIAEGHARDSIKDYLRFLSMAAGSLAEVETQLRLAASLEYVKSKEIDEILDLNEKTLRMLRNLQRSLAKRIPTT
jgi:four helix bundle protein